MNKTKQSPSSNDGLGNFVLVDKKRLATEIAQWGEGVKTKEEVEATADVLFERLRRANMRWK